MELTKQEAIRLHREMWNWIAEQYENGSEETVEYLKDAYCEINNYDAYCNCFCCEYAMYKNEESSIRCASCPLIWGNEDIVNILGGGYYCCVYCFDSETGELIEGLFSLLCKMTESNFTKEERIKIIKLSKQIAELEERKNKGGI